MREFSGEFNRIEGSAMIAIKMARSGSSPHCRQREPGGEVTASAMMSLVKARSGERFTG
jgi:hypothetical protein